MHPSATLGEALQAAILSNDRRKLMELIRRGAVVTESMIDEALTSKPVSLCLILIGGYGKKRDGVEALYNQACLGKTTWLDALIKKGFDLNSPYTGYDNFWELITENGNKALAEHLIELSKAFKNNPSLTHYPTDTSIREKQNALLHLFLVNNANPNFVRDYIFLSLFDEARRLKNDEAVALLIQHGADEKYSERIKFAITPSNVATRTNHNIGITQKNIFIDLPDSKVAVPLHDEALHRSASLNLITSGLSAYIEAKPEISPSEIIIFRQILDAYKFEEEHVREYNYQDQLLGRWQSKLPIILESGWMGHSVGVAIFNDTLIFCNRGILKDPDYNLLFYKITDLEKITPDFIRQICNNSGAPEGFFRTLRQVVDMDHPVSGIKIPDQTGGVCMTANTRSLIEGLLATMKPPTETTRLERSKIIFDGYINSTFLNEVKLLLSELRSVRTKEERDFYYLIFKELLIQLPKNKETNKDQNKLMKFILDEVPVDFKPRFKVDIPDIVAHLIVAAKDEDKKAEAVTDVKYTTAGIYKKMGTTLRPGAPEMLHEDEAKMVEQLHRKIQKDERKSFEASGGKRDDAKIVGECNWLLAHATKPINEETITKVTQLIASVSRAEAFNKAVSIYDHAAMSLLNRAIRTGSELLVKALLEKGVNPNYKDDSYQYATHPSIAVYESRLPEQQKIAMLTLRSEHKCQLAETKDYGLSSNLQRCVNDLNQRTEMQVSSQLTSPRRSL